MKTTQGLLSLLRVKSLLLALSFLATVFSAQAQLPTPNITLAVAPVIQNQTVNLQILVSSPTYSPMPTGIVGIYWGDGQPWEHSLITNTRADAFHTYTNLGTYTIQVYYAGDSNYNSYYYQTLTVTVVQQPPTFTLMLFGDSIVGGYDGAWPASLTYTLGPSTNYSDYGFSYAGFKTPDEAPAVYGMTAANFFPTMFSTSKVGNMYLYMLGQNDSTLTAVPLGLQQYKAAYLASAAWLANIEDQGKYSAQNTAVAQTGSWTTSDLFSSIGLKSTTAGSTLSATLTGNAVYLGLTSTLTTNYTVDVTIDGVDHGPLSPLSSYVGSASGSSAAQDGIRYALGGSISATHNIVLQCINPGTSGCYVDFLASNGFAQSNRTPTILLGAPYPTGSIVGSPFPAEDAAVRTVVSELSGDGLSVGLVDIGGTFSGSLESENLIDGVHPNFNGNNILETMWLSGLTYLATEAQRIDLTSPGSGAVLSSPVSGVLGTSLALTATASSGLPVSYSLLSGAASLQNGTLTGQHAGAVSIQVSQAGNLQWQPAATVALPVVFTAAPTTTGLSVSATSVAYNSPVQLNAAVTSSFGIPSGTASFYADGVLLNSVALDANGNATLSATLAYGTHSLTVNFPGSSDYIASVSAAATVQVLAPPPAVTLNLLNPGNVLAPGLSDTMGVMVTPSIGYLPNVTLSCSNLPVYAACSFNPATVTGATNSAPVSSVLTLNTGPVPASRMRVAMLFGALLVGLVLLPKRRLLGGVLMLLVVVGFSGCGTSSNSGVTPVGTYVFNVTATASDGHNTVSSTLPVSFTIE